MGMGLTFIAAIIHSTPEGKYDGQIYISRVTIFEPGEYISSRQWQQIVNNMFTEANSYAGMLDSMKLTDAIEEAAGENR